MHPQEAPGEREPRLARRSPFVPEAKLCPRCLKPLKVFNRDLMGFVPSEYSCPSCGYVGSVYLTKEPEGTDTR